MHKRSWGAFRVKQARLKFFFARKTRAFSLVEAAIVLGIIGAVLSGVFFASTAVVNHEKLDNATNELYLISNNVRQLFSSRPLPAACTPLNTANYITTLSNGSLNHAVFPSEMVISAAPLINNQWNLSSTVSTAFADLCPGTLASPLAGLLPPQNVSYIDIQYVNIPESACVNLIAQNSIPGRDTGVIRISVNGAAAGALPVTPTAAATLCNNNRNANNTNTVDWYFQFNN